MVLTTGRVAPARSASSCWEADVRAETVLAPRLECAGQLPERLGESRLCPFECKTFQPPLHLPLAPCERFDHMRAENRLIEQQLPELSCRNAPNSNRTPGQSPFPESGARLEHPKRGQRLRQLSAERSLVLDLRDLPGLA